MYFKSREQNFVLHSCHMYHLLNTEMLTYLGEC